jgi:iron complex outermembrane receptor protein
MEELMNIQVTSVSKKAQSLSSAAASVFVISAEDIRRSGITVLPELLRLAPGVQVARLSSGSWAIGIRGFNDEYSNKLLVLVDGRSVYNEFYVGVFWDTLNVSVDDIERIEVIRGPNAAMWGTNAVNGVINIITKSSKSTHGGSVTGGAGSEGSAETVRYGGELAPGANYRIGAQNSQFDPLQILTSISPSRGWINRSGDFRVDWDISSKDSLLVSGGLYQSNLGVVVPQATISSPTAPPADDRIITDGGDVVARWQHLFSETSSIEVRFSYDRMSRNDPQTTARINTLDYGFQQHVLAGSRNETRSYPGDISNDALRTSSATPHHQWQIRSYFDLTRKIQIDTALYYAAAMLQTGIPSISVETCTLAGGRCPRSSSLSASRMPSKPIMSSMNRHASIRFPRSHAIFTAR